MEPSRFLKKFSVSLLTLSILISVGCDDSKKLCTDGVDDHCDTATLIRCMGNEFVPEECRAMNIVATKITPPNACLRTLLVAGPYIRPAAKVPATTA